MSKTNAMIVSGSCTNSFEAQCNDFVKLNESKTKTMIVSGSGTIHLQSIPMTLNETVVKESGDLVILRVMFDAKTTFEKHVRSVSRDAHIAVEFLSLSPLF